MLIQKIKFSGNSMPYLLLVFLHTRIMFLKKSENKYFNFKGKLCIQFSMLFLSSSIE